MWIVAKNKSVIIKPMSTFFEKLTNIPKPVAELAASRKTATLPKEDRHTKLKIETENNVIEPDEEEISEDEGELTVDIYDRGDHIVIQSTVAGVKPEDLDISISNDSVTIRGHRKKMEEVKENDYYYKELFWGTFSRSVILPEEIDEDSAEANLKHGLLTIELPKKKKGSVQKLKVKVN